MGGGEGAVEGVSKIEDVGTAEGAGGGSAVGAGATEAVEVARKEVWEEARVRRRA